MRRRAGWWEEKRKGPKRNSSAEDTSAKLLRWEKKTKGSLIQTDKRSQTYQFYTLVSRQSSIRKFRHRQVHKC